MNWNEFKTVVDEKLAEKGLDGSEEIWYIDVGWPDADVVEVCQDKTNEIYIF